MSTPLREGSAVNTGALTARSGASPRNSIAAPQPRVYDKNSELEKIKRQLYNLIDRIEQLKSK